MCKSADVAELPIASTLDCPSDHFLIARCPVCDAEADASCPRCGAYLEASGACHRGEVERLLALILLQRRVLQYIRSARDSKFTLECYLIAIGDSFADGISMKELGRRFGVTRATVSKQCRMICRMFGLKPSAYMRSEENCAKFRLSNRRPRRVIGV